MTISVSHNPTLSAGLVPTTGDQLLIACLLICHNPTLSAGLVPTVLLDVKIHSLAQSCHNPTLSAGLVPTCHERLCPGLHRESHNPTLSAGLVPTRQGVGSDLVGAWRHNPTLSAGLVPTRGYAPSQVQDCRLSQSHPQCRASSDYKFRCGTRARKR